MPHLLIYCEICECTYSFIQWKNRVRTTTFGFGFCLVLYGAGFGSDSSHCLLSALVQFLAKSGNWFGLFLLGSGSFPPRVKTETQDQSCVYCTSHADCDIRVVCCLPGTTITSVNESVERIWIVLLDGADSTGTPNQENRFTQTTSTLRTHSTIFCCLLLEFSLFSLCIALLCQIQ